MTTNTHRRLTAGLADDNLPAIIDGIQTDIMRLAGHAALHLSPMDTRTTLAILVRQALEELASYWPPQEFADEINSALLDLRCQLLTSLRGDARPVEVLKHAAQTIVQLRQDVEHQAALLLDLNDTLVHQEQELQRLREHPNAPRYDWSGTSGITVSTPSSPLTYHGEDGDGNPILAAVIAPNDEPVGAAVAAPTLESSITRS